MKDRTSFFSATGVGVLASLFCFGAGIYLLLHKGVVPNTWFEGIAHGVGIYFIGKGFFIAVTTHVQAGTRQLLEEQNTLVALLLDRANKDALLAEGRDQEPELKKSEDYSGLPPEPPAR